MTQPGTVTFQAGDRILNKGEAATCAYMIVSGKVRVFLEEGTRRITLGELGENEIFGEAAIFEGNQYGANVEALDTAELYVITPESLNDMLKRSDPIVRTLIRMLIERLKSTNAALLKSETREYMDVVLI